MDEQSLMAAELLLDVGIEIPVKTRWFGIGKLIMRRPTLGAMMRIAHLFGKLGVSCAEIEKKSVDVVDDVGLKRRGRLKKERIKKDVRYQE